MTPEQHRRQAVKLRAAGKDEQALQHENVAKAAEKRIRDEDAKFRKESQATA